MLQQLKNINAKIRWSVIILSVLGAIILSILVLCIINFYPIAIFNFRTIKSAADYQYKDSLICTIVYSSNQAGIKGFNPVNLLSHENFSAFSLHGLNSDTPEMLVNGKKWRGLKKGFENNEILVIQADPPSWSTDSITLMKDSGTFVRIISDIHPRDAIFSFQYAIAQKGRCQ